MPRCVLSPAAEQDIGAILSWTQTHFGELARLRYEALLVQAIADVAENSERPGCIARPEIAHNVWTYHLSLSRRRVASEVGRVKAPRHFLLYRWQGGNSVEIARVLHESMDVARHIPLEDDESPGEFES